MLLVVGQMTSLEPARAAVAQERESVSIRFELDGGTAHLRLTPNGLRGTVVEIDMPAQA